MLTFSKPFSRARFAVTLLSCMAVFTLLALFPSPTHAGKGATGSNPWPFHPGEKLTYELRWGVVPAGTAVLEVRPMETIAGVKAHHFVMTATSNSFLDMFYPVRDRVDAYADKSMAYSLLYKKKQREGRHRRDETVTFDWKSSEVRYANFGKQGKPVSIIPGTFDPLSVFYSFRLQRLEENSELQASVTDGKKCVTGKVRILGRQEIDVGGKKYDTYLAEPDLKEVGGVFKKSSDAKLKIWVSADENRIPLRITSRVAVGDFVAELVSVQKN